MDGGCAADVVSLGDLGAEDQDIFVESHAADVLHCAPVVLGNCNLVVLAEWVCQTEDLFEVGKALLSNFKDIFGIDIFKE